MSIGIAPCFPEPAEVIQSDNGRDYLSFRLNSESECKQYQTTEINSAWKFPEQFRKENPSHPFMLVMDFAKYSKGAKSKSDWIEKAASFLGLSRDSIRKDLSRVSSLEYELPESPLTYILCYIVNRWAAIDWVKSAMPKTVINAGPSVIMLDGNLPKHKRLEILSNI